MTSLALILRQVGAIVLTTHKLKLRVQLLQHSLVSLPRSPLAGQPLLSEVCVLGQFAVTRLPFLPQAQRLLLPTPGFCVKAQAAAPGVCSGSPSQHAVFLLALTLNAGREGVFPAMVILPIFFFTLIIIMIIVFVCLIPYCIKSKLIVFSRTEELDPEVSCYCRHIHVFACAQYHSTLRHFLQGKKSLQLFFSGFSYSVFLLTVCFKRH